MFVTFAGRQTGRQTEDRLADRQTDRQAGLEVCVVTNQWGTPVWRYGGVRTMSRGGLEVRGLEDHV